MSGDQSVGDHVQGQLGDRRLVAAAFADIVGYSILMARDEIRTHARWMRILNEIIRPRAGQHHGRVVKSTGDGVLVEFADAVDSVNWARDVQRSLAPHDGDEALPVALRIGINLGEVIVTADDIYGDSVNLAARLQEHAEPGGIVLSEAVYERARGSIGNSADDLGYLELKHVEHPTRAFAIAPVVGGIAVPVLQRRVALPSIAVLPLQNLSRDSSDDYFGDGIVEDIIVSLASLREMLVISRPTTLKYRGQQPDPRAVGVCREWRQHMG